MFKIKGKLLWYNGENCYAFAVYYLPLTLEDDRTVSTVHVMHVGLDLEMETDILMLNCRNLVLCSQQLKIVLNQTLRMGVFLTSQNMYSIYYLTRSCFISLLEHFVIL